MHASGNDIFKRLRLSSIIRFPLIDMLLFQYVQVTKFAHESKSLSRLNGVFIFNRDR